MNVQQMHLAVQQGVDKINSLQADVLLPQEIDIELNKSLIKFIATRYGKNNIYRKGFEESQKRIDDLRNLVTEFSGQTTFKEELNNTLDSMEMDKVPDDYGADSDDAVNVGWVDGIKYALNGIERKIAVIESKKEAK